MTEVLSHRAGFLKQGRLLSLLAWATACLCWAGCQLTWLTGGGFQVPFRAFCLGQYMRRIMLNWPVGAGSQLDC